jgi:hypothetical protein
MGIRFLCPNCAHKLNVKAFLAGKRGVCPQCGSGLDIPLESQITKGSSDKDDKDDNDGPAPGSAVPAPAGGASPDLASPTVLPGPAILAKPASVSFPASPMAELAAGPQPTVPMGVPVVTPVTATPVVPGPLASVGQPVLPMTAQPPGLANPVINIQTQGSAQPTVPMRGPAPAPPAVVLAPVDPIDEAPEAVWYVRPPTGGQYGPARGDVMRRWLGEGRVSRDSLVWRDGWVDWRNAVQAFPALGLAAAPPTPAAAPLPAYAPTAPHAVTAPTVPRGQRRNSLALAVATVVILGFLSVILLVILVVILNRS